MKFKPGDQVVVKRRGSEWITTIVASEQHCDAEPSYEIADGQRVWQSHLRTLCGR